MGSRNYLQSRAHLTPASSTGVLPPFTEPRAIAISSTIASAGTVATLFLPRSGTRFRIHGGWVTLSAADNVFLRAVGSAQFQWNGRGAVNTPISLSAPPGGTACGSANVSLVLDVGAAATAVTGTIFVSEEE